MAYSSDIHTVQTSIMQYAFGVQMYGEVLYLKFYSVFSEQFINNEILFCERRTVNENGILIHDKVVVNFNSYMENKFSI